LFYKSYDMKKYSREVTPAEMHAMQLAMTEVIDRFCREHHIRYFLDGGSLLGAVRHKGFIPWDDDVDIAMPRPDYERFIQTFNGYDPHLEIQSYYNDIHYPLCWARLIDNRTELISVSSVSGVFIDLIPIDGVPSDPNEYFTTYKSRHTQLKQQLYKATKFYCDYIDKKTGNIKHTNPLIINAKYYLKKLAFPSRSTVIQGFKELYESYPFDTAEYASSVTGRYKNHVKAEVFRHFRDFDFEGRKFLGLENYDPYLSTIYGDYMKLPPVEKRVTAHHHFKTYWKKGQAPEEREATDK